MSVITGQKVPDFTAASTGGEISLSALKGRKLVLYFYPKDNTPGCTTESIDFRDRQQAFTEAGAVIAPPKDPDYLIDALVAAAGDRARLRAMGRAARLQAEQFAWPRVAEQMRAAYARILG